MTRKIELSNKRRPLTLANLREFLEQCKTVEIPDDAVIVDVRGTFGGKLLRLAATDETRQLDRPVLGDHSDDSPFPHPGGGL